MLTVGQRRVDDRTVQRVGRRDMDDVNVGIRRERFEAAVGLGHAERAPLLRRGGFAAGGHRDDVGEPEPAHRIDVMSADESRADQPHADAPGHEVSAPFANSTHEVTSAMAPRLPEYSYSM